MKKGKLRVLSMICVMILALSVSVMPLMAAEGQPTGESGGEAAGESGGESAGGSGEEIGRAHV